MHELVAIPLNNCQVAFEAIKGHQYEPVHCDRDAISDGQLAAQDTELFHAALPDGEKVGFCNFWTWQQYEHNIAFVGVHQTEIDVLLTPT